MWCDREKNEAAAARKARHSGPSSGSTITLWLERVVCVHAFLSALESKRRTHLPGPVVIGPSSSLLLVSSHQAELFEGINVFLLPAPPKPSAVPDRLGH